ncbi:MAG: hypothetical protein BGP24_06160 [Lysobacterales bacterium 69-70]|nr:MAG: hypothetical protein ABT27_20010 [Xanthomonadaceae bacterium SCN 69-25]OJY95189.1 MAG: hypothetical protein BGP24_06160 [Xanthomonadales bacterium 69-70]
MLLTGAGSIAWAAYSPQAVTWLMPLLVMTTLLLTAALSASCLTPTDGMPGRTRVRTFYLGSTSTIVTAA